jgi:serine protease Do
VARLKDDQSAETRTAGAEGNKGALGLAVQTVTPELARQLGLDEPHGVVVRDVRSDSPAANAGIRPGDVIVAVDRHPVKNVEEMKTILDKHPSGTPALLLVRRDGGNLYVPVG